MFDLKTFINQASNSRIRENLLTFRFIYDVKLGAAIRRDELQVYLPEVDKHGYDVILDNQETVRKFQLKTFSKYSKTSSWHIHKTILRPQSYLCENLGFHFDVEHIGLNGGVVLMEFEAGENGIEVDYYYSDIYILLAFKNGIIYYDKDTIKIADKFIDKLMSGRSHEKIEMCKSLFVKAKGPEHLLALMGYYSRFDSSWSYNLTEYIKIVNRNQNKNEVVTATQREKAVIDGLTDLINGRIKYHAI